MRHKVTGRKFGRATDERWAMYRNLVTDLLNHEKVTTTEPKAKEIRSMAEKMITLGKDGNLSARRQALAFIYDEKVTDKLFKELAPRYATRPGGYTRITKLGLRRGDAAPVSVIELTVRGDRSISEAEKKRERRRRSAEKRRKADEAMPPV